MKSTNTIVPSILDTVSAETEKKTKRPPRGKGKGKADKLEEKAYAFIMEQFERYEKLKNDKDFQEKLKKDPYLASTIIKDLAQLAKRILDITVQKLRLEELRAMRGNDTNGAGNGSQVVFILQGRDIPVAGIKTVEINPEDAVKQFKTIGRDV